jgi:glycosidase
MQGVPLIYNGQEIAYPNTISYFQDGTSTPISWNTNIDIYTQYKKIMGIRNALPSVKNGTTSYYPDDNVVAFSRSYQNEETLVLINVRNSSVNYSVPNNLALKSWSNLIDNSTLNLTTSITLSPYSFYILKAD